MTTNAKVSDWTIPSQVSSGYYYGFSEDGWSFGRISSYQRIIFNELINDGFAVEFTLTDYGRYASNSPIVLAYFYTNGSTTPTIGVEGYVNNTASSFSIGGTIFNHNLVKGGRYRIEYTSNSLTVYCDGNLIGTVSNSVGLPTKFEVHTGTNRLYVYKDFLIELL